MEIFKYDSKDVVVSAMGLPVEGFGEGSKVVVSRDGAVSERMKGVDGDITFNFLNSSDGTVTITLKYGCPWDTTFDQLVQAKELIPLSILHKKSNKGLVTVAAVESQPDLVAGTKGEDREWVFGVASTDFGLMSNAASAVAGVQYYTPS